MQYRIKYYNKPKTTGQFNGYIVTYNDKEKWFSSLEDALSFVRAFENGIPSKDCLSQNKRIMSIYK